MKNITLHIRKGLEVALTSLIIVYKKIVSPLLPNTCRYYPTCSTYAIQAIQKKGIIKGVVKAIYRIIRCNPFSKGGYDPV
ncbi:MAG: membrane protein insertion efficiency factor YidD [candidate division KSB1 bacterium]|nr:membrane protein insertion efficiency factor YidD [candidate division KSB1 bacterium]